ncbi:hypothetical protein [Neorhodopirellula lusitana]|uniref:hypothetical protein n=1 Tax=Neorhodopirellula lusitana TaxID=445327 RepID=UPI00384E9BBD
MVKLLSDELMNNCLHALQSPSKLQYEDCCYGETHCEEQADDLDWNQVISPIVVRVRKHQANGWRGARKASELRWQLA